MNQNQFLFLMYNQGSYHSDQKWGGTAKPCLQVSSHWKLKGLLPQFLGSEELAAVGSD